MELIMGRLLLATLLPRWMEYILSKGLLMMPLLYTSLALMAQLNQVPPL